MKWSCLSFCTESFIWDLLFVKFIVVIILKKLLEHCHLCGVATNKWMRRSVYNRYYIILEASDNTDALYHIPFLFYRESPWLPALTWRASRWVACSRQSIIGDKRKKRGEREKKARETLLALVLPRVFLSLVHNHRQSGPGFPLRHIGLFSLRLHVRQASQQSNSSGNLLIYWTCSYSTHLLNRIEIEIFWPKSFRTCMISSFFSSHTVNPDCNEFSVVRNIYLF